MQRFPRTQGNGRIIDFLSLDKQKGLRLSFILSVWLSFLGYVQTRPLLLGLVRHLVYIYTYRSVVELWLQGLAWILRGLTFRNRFRGRGGQGVGRI